MCDVFWGRWVYHGLIFGFAEVFLGGETGSKTWCGVSVFPMDDCWATPSLRPELSCLNAMLSACEKGQRWDLALHLLKAGIWMMEAEDEMI